MKRKIAKAIGLLVLVCGPVLSWVYYDPAPVLRLAVDHELSSRAQANNIPNDRFELLFVGTGSPNRTPSRGQPCTAVIAGGRLFLFDVGEGSTGALAEFMAPIGKLDTIFLTHLHSDHISGLGEVMHNTWLYGRTDEIEVVGPPGTKEVVAGFSQLYDQDTQERQRVLGAENISPELAMGKVREVLAPEDEPLVVFDVDGVKVEAFRVEHNNWEIAYGYRISYKGKTVVISGDTSKTESVPRMATGADILIHEAVNVEAMSMIADGLDKNDIGVPGDRMQRIITAHTPTLQVAEVAQQAQVPHLILTHLIPAVPASVITDRYFTRGMSDIYDGKITVARDGMRVQLNE